MRQVHLGACYFNLLLTLRAYTFDIVRLYKMFLGLSQKGFLPFHDKLYKHFEIQRSSFGAHYSNLVYISRAQTLLTIRLQESRWKIIHELMTTSR